MSSCPENEPDNGRRAFLLQTGTTAIAGIVFSTFWMTSPTLADDDDDNSGSGGGGSDDHDDDDDDDDDDDSGSGGDDDDDNSGRGSSNRGGDDDDDDDDDFRRGDLDQSDAVQAVRSGKAMPLKAALKRVESRYRGTVIDVTLRSTGRRLEYRFKIRTERGTVRTIRMDAGNGRFLGLGALFR